jgi:hypothetical protein
MIELFSVFVSKEAASGVPALAIPLFAAALIAILAAGRRGFLPACFRFVRSNCRQRINISFLLFLFLQTLTTALSVIVLIDVWRKGERTAAGILLAIVSALGAAIFILAVRAIILQRQEAVKWAQDTFTLDMKRMFDSIWDQGQEFQHHTRVMLSYLNENRLEELKSYIDRLVGEIARDYEVLAIGHPAFAALIQAKTAIALHKGIDFQYEFSDLSRLELGVKSIDLIKMTGNLIDNAFDEASKLDGEDDRWVHVGGWMDNGTFYVTVSNPAKTPFSAEELDRMFAPGFTTKQGDHSGLGLSIVKERVEYYKGRIEAETDESGGVQFKLSIPVSGHRKAADSLFRPYSDANGRFHFANRCSGVVPRRTGRRTSASGSGFISGIVCCFAHFLEMAEKTDTSRPSPYEPMVEQQKFHASDDFGLAPDAGGHPGHELLGQPNLERILANHRLQL